jgi:hypothetical protein
LVDEGGAFGFAAHHPVDTKFAHQPLDSAAGSMDVLAGKLPPDLPRAVHLVVLVVNPSDVGFEPLITQHTLRGRTGRGRVISGRGDL